MEIFSTIKSEINIDKINSITKINEEMPKAIEFTIFEDQNKILNKASRVHKIL